ncbi:hypothetical protein D9M68_784410 [compost metagenome]
MEHDNAAAAYALRRRRQGPAMVAVGRTDHGEVGQRCFVLARQQAAWLEALARKLTKNQAHQGNRCTKRLEAAQHRTFRLILDQNVRHSQFRGQVGQRMKRRTGAVQPRPL